ncbi:NAD-dependent epimerase/dehydratase family protein [Candidatus Omnitrophota bacterium]
MYTLRKHARKHKGESAVEYPEIIGIDNAQRDRGDARPLIMDWRSPRKKKWIRAIALIIIIAFLNLDIVYAQGGEPIWLHAKPAAAKEDHPQKRIFSDIHNAKIPHNIAVTRDKYDTGNGDTIINIQDAHASMGAQESIAKVLDALVSDYDLNLIAIEGSEGYINTNLLRTFPIDEIKKSTALRLMGEGRMSAGEFFTITSKEEVHLYGVEDPELYKANVAQFREIYRIRDSVVPQIAALKKELEAFEEKIYSKEIIEFKKRSLSSGDESEGFSRRWEHLKGLSGRFNIGYSGFENLAKLKATLDMEDNIDFKSANRQRDRIIDKLSRLLSEEKLKSLILTSLVFKKEEMSPAGFYFYLKDLAEEEGLDVRGEKAFIQYTRYITLYESIDLVAMFAEAKHFEAAIEERLIKNEDQRMLCEYSALTDLLSGLFDIKLTNGDIKSLLKGLERVKPGDIAGFIRRASSEHGLPIYSEYDIGGIFASALKALDFYRVAEARNAKILENTIRTMREEDQRLAALITGGYHTRGITNLLKKKDASYIVILPKFDEDSEDRPYVAILTNRKSPYQELLSSGRYYLATQALFHGIKTFDEYEYAVKMALREAKDRGEDLRELVELWVEIFEIEQMSARAPIVIESLKGQVELTAGRLRIRLNEIVDDMTNARRDPSYGLTTDDASGVDIAGFTERLKELGGLEDFSRNFDRLCRIEGLRLSDEAKADLKKKVKTGLTENGVLEGASGGVSQAKEPPAVPERSKGISSPKRPGRRSPSGKKGPASGKSGHLPGHQIRNIQHPGRSQRDPSILPSHEYDKRNLLGRYSNRPKSRARYRSGSISGITLAAVGLVGLAGLLAAGTLLAQDLDDGQLFNGGWGAGDQDEGPSDAMPVTPRKKAEATEDEEKARAMSITKLAAVYERLYGEQEGKNMMEAFDHEMSNEEISIILRKEEQKLRTRGHYRLRFINMLEKDRADPDEIVKRVERIEDEETYRKEVERYEDEKNKKVKPAPALMGKAPKSKAKTPVPAPAKKVGAAAAPAHPAPAGVVHPAAPAHAGAADIEDDDLNVLRDALRGRSDAMADFLGTAKGKEFMAALCKARGVPQASVGFHIKGMAEWADTAFDIKTPLHRYIGGPINGLIANEDKNKISEDERLKFAAMVYLQGRYEFYMSFPKAFRGSEKDVKKIVEEDAEELGQFSGIRNKNQQELIWQTRISKKVQEATIDMSGWQGLHRFARGLLPVSMMGAWRVPTDLEGSAVGFPSRDNAFGLERLSLFVVGRNRSVREYNQVVFMDLADDLECYRTLMIFARRFGLSLEQLTALEKPLISTARSLDYNLGSVEQMQYGQLANRLEGMGVRNELMKAFGASVIPVLNTIANGDRQSASAAAQTLNMRIAQAANAKKGVWWFKNLQRETTLAMRRIYLNRLLRVFGMLVKDIHDDETIEEAVRSRPGLSVDITAGLNRLEEILGNMKGQDLSKLQWFAKEGEEEIDFALRLLSEGMVPEVDGDNKLTGRVTQYYYSYTSSGEEVRTAIKILRRDKDDPDLIVVERTEDHPRHRKGDGINVFTKRRDPDTGKVELVKQTRPFTATVPDAAGAPGATKKIAATEHMYFSGHDKAGRPTKVEVKAEFEGIEEAVETQELSYPNMDPECLPDTKYDFPHGNDFRKNWFDESDPRVKAKRDEIKRKRGVVHEGGRPAAIPDRRLWLEGERQRLAQYPNAEGRIPPHILAQVAAAPPAAKPKEVNSYQTGGSMLNNGLIRAKTVTIEYSRGPKREDVPVHIAYTYDAKGLPVYRYEHREGDTTADGRALWRVYRIRSDKVMHDTRGRMIEDEDTTVLIEEREGPDPADIKAAGDHENRVRPGREGAAVARVGRRGDYEYKHDLKKGAVFLSYKPDPDIPGALIAQVRPDNIDIAGGIATVRSIPDPRDPAKTIPEGNVMVMYLFGRVMVRGAVYACSQHGEFSPNVAIPEGEPGHLDMGAVFVYNNEGDKDPVMQVTGVRINTATRKTEGVPRIMYRFASRVIDAGKPTEYTEYCVQHDEASPEVLAAPPEAQVGDVFMSRDKNKPAVTKLPAGIWINDRGGLEIPPPRPKPGALAAAPGTVRGPRYGQRVVDRGLLTERTEHYSQDKPDGSAEVAVIRHDGARVPVRIVSGVRVDDEGRVIDKSGKTEGRADEDIVYYLGQDDQFRYIKVGPLAPEVVGDTERGIPADPAKEGEIYRSPISGEMEYYGISANASMVRRHCGEMRGRNIGFLRTQVGFDGRVLFSPDGRRVTGYDDAFRRDVRTKLDIAQSEGRQVEFVLIDHIIFGESKVVSGVFQQGREEIVTDPAAQKAYIQGFLIPFVREFGAHPALKGIDLLNEPEWIDLEPGQVLDFVRVCAWAVRDNSPDGRHIPLTIGVNTQSRADMEQFVMPYAALAAEGVLDYIGLHHYEDRFNDAGKALMANINALNALGIPWAIEEFATSDSDPNDYAHYARLVKENGGLSIAAWNFNPGLDKRTWRTRAERDKELKNARAVFTELNKAGIAVGVNWRGPFGRLSYGKNYGAYNYGEGTVYVGGVIIRPDGSVDRTHEKVKKRFAKEGGLHWVLFMPDADEVAAGKARAGDAAVYLDPYGDRLTLVAGIANIDDHGRISTPPGGKLRTKIKDGRIGPWYAAQLGEAAEELANREAEPGDILLRPEKEGDATVQIPGAKYDASGKQVSGYSINFYGEVIGPDGRAATDIKHVGREYYFGEAERGGRRYRYQEFREEAPEVKRGERKTGDVIMWPAEDPAAAVYEPDEKAHVSGVTVKENGEVKVKTGEKETVVERYTDIYRRVQLADGEWYDFTVPDALDRTRPAACSPEGERAEYFGVNLDDRTISVKAEGVWNGRGSRKGARGFEARGPVSYYRTQPRGDNFIVTEHKTYADAKKGENVKYVSYKLGKDTPERALIEELVKEVPEIGQPDNDDLLNAIFTAEIKNRLNRKGLKALITRAVRLKNSLTQLFDKVNRKIAMDSGDGVAKVVWWAGDRNDAEMNMLIALIKEDAEAFQRIVEFSIGIDDAKLIDVIVSIAKEGLAGSRTEEEAMAQINSAVNEILIIKGRKGEGFRQSAVEKRETMLGFLGIAALIIAKLAFLFGKMEKMASDAPAEDAFSAHAGMKASWAAYSIGILMVVAAIFSIGLIRFDMIIAMVILFLLSAASSAYSFVAGRSLWNAGWKTYLEMSDAGVAGKDSLISPIARSLIDYKVLAVRMNGKPRAEAKKVLVELDTESALNAKQKEAFMSLMENSPDIARAVIAHEIAERFFIRRLGFNVWFAHSFAILAMLPGINKMIAPACELEKSLESYLIRRAVSKQSDILVSLEAINTLGRIGLTGERRESVVGELEEMIARSESGAHWRKVQAVARLLGTMENGSSYSVLERLLLNKTWVVRMEAVRSVGRRGPPKDDSDFVRVVSQLREMASNDNSVEVRRAAVTALAAFAQADPERDPSILDYLIAIIMAPSENRMLQKLAIIGIAPIDNEKVLKALRGVMAMDWTKYDPDDKMGHLKYSDICNCAAWALGQVASPERLDALVLFIQDDIQSMLTRRLMAGQLMMHADLGRIEILRDSPNAVARKLGDEAYYALGGDGVHLTGSTIARLPDDVFEALKVPGREANPDPARRVHPMPDTDAEKFTFDIKDTKLRYKLPGPSLEDKKTALHDIWQIHEDEGADNKLKPVKAGLDQNEQKPHIFTWNGEECYMKLIAGDYQSAAFTVNLVQDLYEHRYPVAPFVPTPDGALCVKIGNYYFAIARNLSKIVDKEDAVHIEGNEALGYHFMILGRAIGQFQEWAEQRHLAGLKEEYTITDVNENRQHESGRALDEQGRAVSLRHRLEQVLEEYPDPNDINGAPEGVRILVENISMIAGGMDMMENRSVDLNYYDIIWRVIHFDFRFDNVRFNKLVNMITEIFDWDKLSYQVYVEDFKNTVVNHGFGRIFDPLAFMSVIRGYASVKGLDPQEARFMADLLRGTLLNCMYGRFMPEPASLKGNGPARFEDDAVHYRHIDGSFQGFVRRVRMLIRSLDGRATAATQAAPTPLEERVANLRPPVVGELVKRAKSQNEEDKPDEAVNTLRAMGAVESAPELLALVKDNTRPADTRTQAAIALAVFGWNEGDVIGELLNIIRNEDEPEEAREGMVIALEKFMRTAFAAENIELEKALTEKRLEDDDEGLPEVLYRHTTAALPRLERELLRAIGEWRTHSIEFARRAVADRTLSAGDRLYFLKVLKANEAAVRNSKLPLGGRVDLHLHTYHSDGESTPSNVVFQAWKDGLRAIAICDHNTLDELDESYRAAKILGIELVLGVEVGVNVRLKEAKISFEDAHCLCFWQAPETQEEFDAWINSPAIRRLREVLDELSERQMHAMRELLEKFNSSVGAREGLELTEEDAAGYVTTLPNRFQVAKALFEKYGPAKLGCRDHKETAKKYFRSSGKPGLAASMILPIIVKSGAVVVFAHPGERYYRDKPHFYREFIAKYRTVRVGRKELPCVRGLEAYSSKHSDEQKEEYGEYCESEGLIATLGTDCHLEPDMPYLKVGYGDTRGSDDGNMPEDTELHSRVLTGLKAQMQDASQYGAFTAADGMAASAAAKIAGIALTIGTCSILASCYFGVFGFSMNMPAALAIGGAALSSLYLFSAGKDYKNAGREAFNRLLDRNIDGDRALYEAIAFSGVDYVKLIENIHDLGMRKIEGVSHADAVGELSGLDAGNILSDDQKDAFITILEKNPRAARTIAAHERVERALIDRGWPERRAHTAAMFAMLPGIRRLYAPEVRIEWEWKAKKGFYTNRIDKPDNTMGKAVSVLLESQDKINAGLGPIVMGAGFIAILVQLIGRLMYALSSLSMIELVLSEPVWAIGIFLIVLGLIWRVNDKPFFSVEGWFGGVRLLLRRIDSRFHISIKNCLIQAEAQYKAAQVVIAGLDELERSIDDGSIKIDDENLRNICPRTPLPLPGDRIPHLLIYQDLRDAIKVARDECKEIMAEAERVIGALKRGERRSMRFRFVAEDIIKYKRLMVEGAEGEEWHHLKVRPAPDNRNTWGGWILGSFDVGKYGIGRFEWEGRIGSQQLKKIECGPRTRKSAVAYEIMALLDQARTYQTLKGYCADQGEFDKEKELLHRAMEQEVQEERRRGSSSANLPTRDRYAKVIVLSSIVFIAGIVILWLLSIYLPEVFSYIPGIGAFISGFISGLVDSHSTPGMYFFKALVIPALLFIFLTQEYKMRSLIWRFFGNDRLIFVTDDMRSSASQALGQGHIDSVSQEMLVQEMLATDNYLFSHVENTRIEAFRKAVIDKLKSVSLTRGAAEFIPEHTGGIVDTGSSSNTDAVKAFDDALKGNLTAEQVPGALERFREALLDHRNYLYIFLESQEQDRLINGIFGGRFLSVLTVNQRSGIWNSMKNASVNPVGHAALTDKGVSHEASKTSKQCVDNAGILKVLDAAGVTPEQLYVLAQATAPSIGLQRPTFRDTLEGQETPTQYIYNNGYPIDRITLNMVTDASQAPKLVRVKENEVYPLYPKMKGKIEIFGSPLGGPNEPGVQNKPRIKPNDTNWIVAHWIARQEAENARVKREGGKREVKTPEIFVIYDGEDRAARLQYWTMAIGFTGIKSAIKYLIEEARTGAHGYDWDRLHPSALSVNNPRLYSLMLKWSIDPFEVGKMHREYEKFSGTRGLPSAPAGVPAAGPARPGGAKRRSPSGSKKVSAEVQTIRDAFKRVYPTAEDYILSEFTQREGPTMIQGVLVQVPYGPNEFGNFDYRSWSPVKKGTLAPQDRITPVIALVFSVAAAFLASYLMMGSQNASFIVMPSIIAGYVLGMVLSAAAMRGLRLAGFDWVERITAHRPVLHLDGTTNFIDMERYAGYDTEGKKTRRKQWEEATIELQGKGNDPARKLKSPEAMCLLADMEFLKTSGFHPAPDTTEDKRKGEEFAERRLKSRYGTDRFAESYELHGSIPDDYQRFINQRSRWIMIISMAQFLSASFAILIPIGSFMLSGWLAALFLTKENFIIGIAAVLVGFWLGGKIGRLVGRAIIIRELKKGRVHSVQALEDRIKESGWDNYYANILLDSGFLASIFTHMSYIISGFFVYAVIAKQILAPIAGCAHPLITINLAFINSIMTTLSNGLGFILNTEAGVAFILCFMGILVVHTLVSHLVSERNVRDDEGAVRIGLDMMDSTMRKDLSRVPKDWQEAQKKVAELVDNAQHDFGANIPVENIANVIRRAEVLKEELEEEAKKMPPPTAALDFLIRLARRSRSRNRALSTADLQAVPDAMTPAYERILEEERERVIRLRDDRTCGRIRFRGAALWAGILGIGVGLLLAEWPVTLFGTAFLTLFAASLAVRHSDAEPTRFVRACVPLMNISILVAIGCLFAGFSNAAMIATALFLAAGLILTRRPVGMMTYYYWGPYFWVAFGMPKYYLKLIPAAYIVFEQIMNRIDNFWPLTSKELPSSFRRGFGQVYYEILAERGRNYWWQRMIAQPVANKKAKLDHARRERRLVLSTLCMALTGIVGFAYLLPKYWNSLYSKKVFVRISPFVGKKSEYGMGHLRGIMDEHDPSHRYWKIYQEFMANWRQNRIFQMLGAGEAQNWVWAETALADYGVKKNYPRRKKSDTIPREFELLYTDPETGAKISDSAMMSAWLGEPDADFAATMIKVVLDMYKEDIAEGGLRSESAFRKRLWFLERIQRVLVKYDIDPAECALEGLFLTEHEFSLGSYSGWKGCSFKRAQLREDKDHIVVQTINPNGNSGKRHLEADISLKRMGLRSAVLQVGVGDIGLPEKTPGSDELGVETDEEGRKYLDFGELGDRYFSFEIDIPENFLSANRISPNGIEAMMFDIEGNRREGSWVNVGGVDTDPETGCKRILIVMYPDTQKGFDPHRVASIGLHISVGRYSSDISVDKASRDSISGKFIIRRCRIQKTDPGSVKIKGTDKPPALRKAEAAARPKGDGLAATLMLPAMAFMQRREKVRREGATDADKAEERSLAMKLAALTGGAALLGSIPIIVQHLLTGHVTGLIFVISLFVFVLAQGAVTVIMSKELFAGGVKNGPSTLAISGSTGFIGSNLAGVAAQDGSEVTALTRAGSRNIGRLPVDGRITTAQSDLTNLDYAATDALMGRLAKAQGAFYHLAAESNHTRCAEDPVQALIKNCVAPAQLQRLAEKRGTRFVAASTFYIYSLMRRPVGEPVSEEDADRYMLQGDEPEMRTLRRWVEVCAAKIENYAKRFMTEEGNVESPERFIMDAIMGDPAVPDILDADFAARLKDLGLPKDYFYPMTKLLMETVLRRRQRYDNSVIVRFSNIYGPRQDANYKIPSYILGKVKGGKKVLTGIAELAPGEAFTFWSKGRRDYLYIGDCARGLLRIGAAPLKDRVINVASGQATPNEAIVEEIADALGKRIVMEPDKERQDKDVHICDNSRFSRYLPPKASTPLKAGIKKTVEYYTGPAYTAAGAAPEGGRPGGKGRKSPSGAAVGFMPQVMVGIPEEDHDEDEVEEAVKVMGTVLGDKVLVKRLKAAEAEGRVEELEGMARRRGIKYSFLLGHDRLDRSAIDDVIRPVLKRADLSKEQLKVICKFVYGKDFPQIETIDLDKLIEFWRETARSHDPSFDYTYIGKTAEWMEKKESIKTASAVTLGVLESGLDWASRIEERREVMGVTGKDDPVAEYILVANAREKERAKKYLEVTGLADYVSEDRIIVARTTSEAVEKIGLPSGSIGIRMLETDTLEKDESEVVVLKLQKKGEVYLNVNMYEVLFEIMAAIDDGRQPPEIDGLNKESYRVYTYMPDAASVDYADQVDRYRLAIEMLLNAA